MSGVRSMTGFGSGHFDAEGRRYRVDVKTVNHRHLNTRFHLPNELSGVEADAKRLLRERLERGAVDVVVHLESAGERSIQVEVDRAGFTTLGRTLQELAVELSAPPPTLELMVRLGDFVRVTGAKANTEALSDAFLDGLAAAADAVDTMRLREGQALASDLLARLDKMDELLLRIEHEAPQVQAAYEARLRARLDEAARKHGVEVEPGRLATELILFADKSDVTEETVRARTHIHNVRLMLASTDDEARGKRLDFMAQELNREFNTIGSKCRDAQMAGAVVDAKVELERIREQVQNIV